MELSESLEREWRQVTAWEVDALREVAAHIVRHTRLAQVAAAAAVYEYDLRNFISRASQRPKYRVGLRLLKYVTSDEAPPLEEDVENLRQKLIEACDRIASLDPDDDYYFRYLRRYRIISEDDCIRTCGALAGNYYCYRLSSFENHVIISHLQIPEFNPYNKIPRFVNRAKYKLRSSRIDQIKKAEGQLIILNGAAFFNGFVLESHKRRQDYSGAKVMIVSYEELLRSKSVPCRGIFSAYVYEGTYDYGRIIILKTDDEYDEHNIGEFEISSVTNRMHGINIEELKSNKQSVTDHVNTSCDSFVL